MSCNFYFYLTYSLRDHCKEDNIQCGCCVSLNDNDSYMKGQQVDRLPLKP